MGLTRVAREFILHWGEMSSRWGLNRTVAQVHALLYLSVDPLTAEDIAEALSVGRSNVSTSLRELQNWKLVRATHHMGDRREFFFHVAGCVAALSRRRRAARGARD